MNDTYINDYQAKVDAIIGHLSPEKKCEITEEVCNIWGDALTDEAYLQALTELVKCPE